MVQQPNLTKTFGITAESHPDIWNLLQRPEDRKTPNPLNAEGTEEDNESGREPEQEWRERDHTCNGWEAIEPDDDPTELMKPLPWLDSQVIEINLRLTEVEKRQNRDINMLICDNARLEVRLAKISTTINELETRLEALEGGKHWTEEEADVSSRPLIDWDVQEDGSLVVRDYPHKLIETLRVGALTTLAIGVFCFIGAVCSGSQEQKDELAMSGTFLAAAGVAATAIGLKLNDD